MKKYLYNLKIFAIAIILNSFLFSCSDATDIVQINELNEEAAYQSIADLQSGLNGAYAAYGPDFGSNGGGDALFFNTIFTDNAKKGLDSNGQGNQLYSFIMQPGTGVALTIWSNRYSTINYVNRVLRAMSNVTPADDAETTEKNHIKGQLLGLRALAHLDLFMYYTSDYQDPNAFSIINMDYVPSIEDQLERNKVSETIQFIKDDLAEAELNLDETNGTAATNIFINKDVIKALKVRLGLVEGTDYGTVATLAGELVTDYPLSNTTQYFNMFADTEPGESIFTLTRGQADGNLGDIFYFNAVALSGGAYIEMSNQLFNEFEFSDIRFFVNVNLESVINGTNDPDNILLINKYPGSIDGPLQNDFKMIRSSEMLLIRAEAEARNSLLIDARNSVQELKDARYGGSAPQTPVFASVNEALTEILKERRKELCFEGHRYLDLKRLGAELNIGISRESVDCASFSAPCNLSSSDYRFTLPIPTAETGANTNITQNPDY